MRNIDTYYAVHFWRVITSTRMDTSYRFQPFFIPHVCAVRAVRWRKLKGGASSVVHLWRDNILSSVLCAFTVVIHCLKKTTSVKTPKPIHYSKNKHDNACNWCAFEGVLPLLELYCNRNTLKLSTLLLPQPGRGKSSGWFGSYIQGIFQPSSLLTFYTALIHPPWKLLSRNLHLFNILEGGSKNTSFGSNLSTATSLKQAFII